MLSPIKQDECVQFFPTSAWPGNDGDWNVDVHGAIFELQKRPILERVLRRALGLPRRKLTAEEEAVFQHRFPPFLYDNQRGKALPVSVGSAVHVLPKSEPNGHFSDVVRLSHADVAAADDNGWLPISTKAPEADGRTFAGKVQLVTNEDAISIISDVDDTIKASNVLDRKSLMRSTFCRAFKAIPGMSEVYRNWRAGGKTAFHFVTSSPWQICAPLQEFLMENDFPLGCWHMRHVRLVSPFTLVALFCSPTRYKTLAIENLMARWSRRKFVLVGDTTEKDPEIFGGIAAKHGARIHRIFLRNCTGEQRTNARLTKAMAGTGSDVWQLFENPAELPRTLS